jgi:hypothetical protein
MRWSLCWFRFADSSSIQVLWSSLMRWSRFSVPTCEVWSLFETGQAIVFWDKDPPFVLRSPLLPAIEIVVCVDSCDHFFFLDIEPALNKVYYLDFLHKRPSIVALDFGKALVLGHGLNCITQLNGLFSYVVSRVILEWYNLKRSVDTTNELIYFETKPKRSNNK